MHRHFEAVEQRASTSGALLSKASVTVLEMSQRAPEHKGSKRGVADFVGVGEVVARGRGESEGGNGARFEPQPVADVIEAQGMGQLHEEHCAQMTEHGVGACFGIDARFLGCLVDDATRNELEDLPKNIDVVACWLSGWCVC